MVSTLRLVLAVIVPFGVSLVVLGPSLSTVLFSWGHAAGDTASLGQTLVAFAPGMVMFSVHYTLLRGFYAVEDTRTPFFIQCVIAAVNITLAIGLTLVVSPEFVAPALALAYGASYTVGALVSIAVLSYRLGGLDRRTLAGFAVRVATAAVPAALLAWVLIYGLERLGLDVASKTDSVVLLSVGGLAGLLAYLLLARVLSIREISSIVRLVVYRGRGPGPG
jgi:putative peptidoglycan lipid II flippase